MAQLRQLPLQARKARASLRQRRALGQHVGACNRAQVEAPFDDLQLILLQLFDVFGGLDLRSQRRLSNRGGCQVGRQRQVSRLQLEVGVVDLRFERLDLAPDAAEHIQRVRHVDRRVVQRENALAAQSDRGGRNPFALHAELAAGIGPQGAVLRHEGLLRLPQRGLRGCDGWAVAQSLIDQPVQRLGAKQRPPLPLQRAAQVELLGASVRSLAGRRGGRQGGVGVAGQLWRLRALEVRPDRTRSQRGGRQRGIRSFEHGIALSRKAAGRF